LEAPITAAPVPFSRGGAPTVAAGDQEAVARALRAAFACAAGYQESLASERRAACGKRISEAAVAMGPSKVDTIPPLKRAYYDAVEQAYQDIRHYQTPDTTLTHLPGAMGIYDQRVANMPGHIPYAGVGLQLGGRSTTPPHSLKVGLGPLAIVVTAPQGVLTEESAIPSADDRPKH